MENSENFRSDPRHDLTHEELRAREDNLAPLGETLPGVLDEIHKVSQTPLLQARRNLTDLQRRFTQGDPSVSEAAIAEAKAWLEDEVFAEQEQPADDIDQD